MITTAHVIIISGANCCSFCSHPLQANPNMGCHEKVPGSGEVTHIPNSHIAETGYPMRDSDW